MKAKQEFNKKGFAWALLVGDTITQIVKGVPCEINIHKYFLCLFRHWGVILETIDSYKKFQEHR